MSEIPPWSLEQLPVPIPILRDGLESAAELGLKCPGRSGAWLRQGAAGWVGAGASGGIAGDQQGGEQRTALLLLSLLKDPLEVRVWPCCSGDPFSGWPRMPQGALLQVIPVRDLVGRVLGTLPQGSWGCGAAEVRGGRTGEG